MKKTGILIALITWFNFGLFAQSKVEIHQIDVGTGDAALINIMNNAGGIQYSILVDAGDTDQEETVITYLQSNAKQFNGKVYLDYVISSHYHSDHIGGMVGMLTPIYAAVPGGKKRKICGEYYSGILGDTDKVSVFAVLDKGDSNPVPSTKTANKRTTLFGKYKTLAGLRRITVGSTTIGAIGAINSIVPSAAATPVAYPNANQRLSLGGFIDLGTDANGVPVRLRLVLADSKVYNPSIAVSNTYNVADTLSKNWNVNVRNRRQNENNWGLAWVLEYGAFRFYTAGDVGGYNSSNGTCISCGSNYFDIETPLADAFIAIYGQPNNALGHICVQKVSHHGSCCSSNDSLLGTLKCSSALISSGTEYQHPTQEVITRLETGTWIADSLMHNRLKAYIMTELVYENRNIDLSIGSTSGSAQLVATDKVVDLLKVAVTHVMANGTNLYLFQNPPVVPIVPGNIVLKVNPTNYGFPISKRSYYSLNYLWYDGSAIVKDILCHGQ